MHNHVIMISKHRKSTVVHNTPNKTIYYCDLYTVWCRFLLRENIDKIDKFLVIHQNFPNQVFLLAIANVVPATVLLIIYSSNSSQSQFLNISFFKN